MNKRLISVLICVCLLLSMMVVPVNAQAVEGGKTSVTDLCPCGCEKTLSQVEWSVYDPNTNGEPAGGHYYLAENYIQKEQVTIISGNKVVLDLRGHTVTTDDYHRLFLLYGYLAILDTVGGGRASAKTTGAGFGGVIMASTNETNDTTLELYSGTITPDADNKGSRRGGLIHLSESATFRMYGGRLLNGSTVSTSNPDKKEPGGCVAANSSASTVEILGGEIIGGVSASYGGNIYSVGTTVLKNCKIIGGNATSSGGNICQNGGTLTIENCVISDGVTASSGGNICTMSSTVMSVKDSTVRNGNAGNHGGNFYMGTSSGVIENTAILAGVAATRGNNIYGSTTSTTLTIKDCQIPGDVSFVGEKITLEGKVKIGLLNNGLKLWYGSDAAEMDASALTEGSEIYLDGKATFIGANDAYFKGAMRTVLTKAENGFTATQAASGETGGYCPHCNQQVAWKEFSVTDSLIQNCLMDSATDEDPACTGRHIDTGHYYLGASLSDSVQYYSGVYLSGSGTIQTHDVVLDLNGCSVSATGRFFYLRVKDADGNANKLTFMDSVGGGSVTGHGTNSQGGGVIYNEGCELTIYGGKFVYKPSSTRNVTSGGVVYNGGDFTMHGGILDASAYAYTDKSTTDKTYTYNGGALYTGSGTKSFTMTAGRLIGGTAQSGGTAYFGYNNQVNITGGQFHGGNADVDYGGNIRLYSKKVSGSYPSNGVLNLSNAAVTGGTATSAGGNVYIQYYTTDVNNCYIANGDSSDYGGNFSCGTSSNSTITDCVILNGSAKRGGNVYEAATSATVKLDGCLVTNGKATTYSGNLHIGNGNMDILGGEISYGTAGSYGGNMSAIAGNYSATSTNYTRIKADSEGNVPLIVGGTAVTNGGNFYVGGVLYLEDALVNNGVAASGLDIYLPKASNQGKLDVGSGVTGDISMYVVSSLLGSNVFGEPVGNTVCQELNADITLEGDYGQPPLCARAGVLYVGATAVIDADGNVVWYTDNASAMEASGEGDTLKLYTDNDVVLTKNCTVDLNGHKVNVSGAYTVNCADTAGGGSVTLAEETTANEDFTDTTGNRYLAVRDGNTITFHRLYMGITSVSLRTGADGIYYTAKWNCDETLKDQIEQYGVALSLYGMPDADFQALGSKCLWTAFDKDSFENNVSKTSAMVGGIMKTAEEGRTAALNKTYGEMSIYAAAYVVLTDGTVLVSNDNIAYSLYDVLKTVDDLIANDPQNYRTYTNTVRAFYEKWDDFGMESWQFEKIPQPEDDGVIDVLFVGGSFSYYYVEELYGMAAAAGIPMRVCNLYYSGAGPKQHWTWWKNGETPCQFYNTDGNGRVKTDNVGLEWALAQGDWDVISMQYPSGTVRTATPQEGFDSLDSYSSELSTYLKEQFPDALFCWQQVWAYQVGYDRDGYSVPTVEVQTGLYERHKELAIMAASAYDALLIPSGDAWQNVRAGGYDNLCARLGKGENHEGDYYHEGDIGGGQYLNACVWFEMITGESCVGNTYVPTYVYNGTQYSISDQITIEALQNAAHQAVVNLRAE